MVKIRKFFGLRRSNFRKESLVADKYEHFKLYLQLDAPKEERQCVGLERTLRSFFPFVFSKTTNSKVEYLDYDICYRQHNLDELVYNCQTNSLKLSINCMVVMRNDSFRHSIVINEFPMMHENGCFLINGIYKFLVGQMVKSHGPIFTVKKETTSCRINPLVGLYCSIEISSRTFMYFKIGKKRRIPLTVFLYMLDTRHVARYLRLSPEEEKKAAEEPFATLHRLFAKEFETRVTEDKKFIIRLADEEEAHAYRFAKLESTVLAVQTSPDGYKEIVVDFENLSGITFARDVVLNGEVIIRAASTLTSVSVLNLKKLREASKFSLFFFKKCDEVLDKTFRSFNEAICKAFILKNRNNLGLTTFTEDEDSLVQEDEKVHVEEVKTTSKKQTTVSKKVEARVFKNIRELTDRILLENPMYDISLIGRYRLNKIIGSTSEGQGITLEDLIACIKRLVLVHRGEVKSDHIDSLKIKRIKDASEIVDMYLRNGITKMLKNMDKNILQGVEAQGRISGILSSSPIVGELKKLFNSSPYVQFLDQTNPLSDLSHRRRFTLYNQGSAKFKANLEVRDVDPSYYGMLCPIETPEGLNVGLINSLAFCARVNKLGFLEAPFYIVKDSKITEEFVYMTAEEAEKHVIATFDNLVDDQQNLIGQVTCRFYGSKVVVPPSEVKFIDVVGNQIASVASSSIVFIKNNDGMRALMGANMQRQAKPLLESEVPIVGTGCETTLIENAGKNLYSEVEGRVLYLNSRHIIIYDEANRNIHMIEVPKFRKSGMRTCFNSTIKVKKGDYVHKGQLLCDGPNSEKGEMGLGKDVLVALLSLNGENFEDSIVVSEKCILDGIFTSILMVEFEIMTRDTELGPEQFTRDVPNATYEEKMHLDENGIVKVGTTLTTEKIVTGIIAPTKETISHEEKLLKALLGTKAEVVKDISFKAPRNFCGIVVDVRLYDENAKVNSFKQFIAERKQEQLLSLKEAIANLLGEKLSFNYSNRREWETILPEKVREITTKALDHIDDLELRSSAISFKRQYESSYNSIVRVRVAIEMPLQVGDKMSGRHGNKGVVSKILPVEDMPYLEEDGTPIDIVLSPLSIPSRMNIGQIKEMNLGLASFLIGKKVKVLLEAQKHGDARNILKKLFEAKHDVEALKAIEDDQRLMEEFSEGKIYFECPAFNTRDTDEVLDLLSELFPFVQEGKLRLCEGATGERLARSSLVGYQYLLKLMHLASEKIHARSTGNYSLITQQPVPGKQRNGGARIGEMEIWALMAHGAYQIILESTTIKSDDVIGRREAFLKMMDGKLEECSIFCPESFNVLTNYLKACCLDVKTLELSESFKMQKVRMELRRKVLSKVEAIMASETIQTCIQSKNNDKKRSILEELKTEIEKSFVQEKTKRKQNGRRKA